MCIRIYIYIERERDLYIYIYYTRILFHRRPRAGDDGVQEAQHAAALVLITSST